MYSDELLAAKQARIGKNLTYIVETDIPAAAPAAYRAAAKRARAVLTPRGSETLDFYHDRNEVVVPIDAMQMLDDLAVLRAWLDRNGCDGSVFNSYIFWNAGSEGFYKSPMAAFGLDRDKLLADRAIDHVSDFYYTSAVWFLLAHEVGHVAVGPVGPTPVADERAADAFALTAMRNKHLPPVGAALLFPIIALTNQGEGVRDHPGLGDRVRAAAAAMKRSPGDFVAPESHDAQGDIARMRTAAADLREVGATMDAIAASEAKLVRAHYVVDKVRAARLFPRVDYAKACPAGRRGPVASFFGSAVVKTTLLAMALIGVFFLARPAAARPAAPAARTCTPAFIGNRDYRMLPDGLHMTLLNSFSYRDAGCTLWYVPPGFTTDGASIPRIFWSMIGGPFEGKYRDAATVHDEFCVRKSMPWQRVHRMFYEAMLTASVERTKAKIMYAAVLWKGPRWTAQQVADARLQNPALARAALRIDPGLLQRYHDIAFAHDAQVSPGFRYITERIERENIGLDRIDLLAEEVRALDGLSHAPAPRVR